MVLAATAFLPFARFDLALAAIRGPRYAVDLSFKTAESLLPSAFSIAMPSESLLCAVVLDGMTGKRHSANSELLGQGIGVL